MKGLRKGFARFGVLNSALLFLYLAAVFAVEFYLEPSRKLFYAAVFLGLLFACPTAVWLLQRFPGIRAGSGRSSDTPAKRAAWFAAFALLSFAVFYVWYRAYYPMSLSNDTLDQYAQVVSGAYSDWHPALHTLLVFTVSLALTGNAGSIILFQILAFSLALAYLGVTLLRYGNPLYAVAALLLVLGNPNTGSIAVYPMKDVTFAIGATLVFAMGLCIWFTFGEWASKWWRLALLIATLTVTTVVRHNAVLFTLPYGSALMLLLPKRRRVVLLTGVLLGVALIKGALYPALQVEKPGLRQLETLGLPLTVISGVAKEHPERLDATSRAFLDAVAPPESWRQFTVGSFNSYKWMVNLAAIEEAGARTVLHTALDCVQSDPRDAFTGLFLLTRMVYCMDDSGEAMRALANGLPYRDFVTVGLLVDRLRLKNETSIPTLGNIVPDCWIYVQETDVKLGRIQIFNNWSPYMVADPEHTVWVGLEYFCDEGDAFWRMSDRDTVDFAAAELAKMGVIDASDVRDACCKRVQKAYPAYFDAYAHIDEIVSFVDGHKNLLCIGRNGQHRYNNMDHSMLTAIRAAEIIRAGGTDRAAVWNVNTESEYHEEKKG